MTWGTYGIFSGYIQDLNDCYRMSLNETLDTYSYFITEADKLGLAYIALVRDIELLSPVIDGEHLLIIKLHYRGSPSYSSF